MLDQQTPMFLVADAAGTSETTFRLGLLEVYNWGPFRGLHRAEFDPFGTAIIGPTGSGKTTLVDALMTLLVPQPRYNLASTGGHESDRTLVSYVRGVLGGDGSDGCEEVARPGKTITGICATYFGGSEMLRLAGLLWTDGPSNAAEDLKRRWIFSQADDQTLSQWLQQLNDEGIRELMRSGRETAKLRIFDSKTAYLAHVRKFFDVGENAFTLLNRAAGLKQLNSIDEIFRDLVLDDRSAFERAREVAGEFDNLAAIHTELEIARRQQESLAPIAEEHQKLVRAQQKVDRWQTLKNIVSMWFGVVGQQKWEEVLEQNAKDRETKQSEWTGLEQVAQDWRSRVDTLRERYLKLGGNVIGELENLIDAQQKLVTDRIRPATDYRRKIAKFNLSDELSPTALHHNQGVLGEKQNQVQQERNRQHEKTLGAFSHLRNQSEKRDEITATLNKVKSRPGSNIPAHFQDFRAELASHLSLPEGELPFLAELLEVEPSETAWRGAIERAIGSDRLRVLVPGDCLDRALRWVNHRDNRVHVRLQHARLDESPVTFFSDGYTRKLNFKEHPLLGTAKRLLASRDLHCVATPEALKTVEHALTIQGMMSGQRGKFEKQDQRKLDQDWMTGFDNKDQLDVLTGQLREANTAVEHWEAELQRHNTALNQLDEQLKMIDSLLQLEFSTIDLPGAELELSRSRERLKKLLDPNSDAGHAKTEYDSASEKLRSIEEQVRKIERAIAVLDHSHLQADKQLKNAIERQGRGLSEDETALAKKYLPIAPDVPAGHLGDEERKKEHLVDEKLEQKRNSVKDSEKQLVRLMEVARGVDTGALADIGSDIDDVLHYLDRLRVLNEEALPEKRKRFLSYLNRSSDQGVTQLLAGIEEEVDAIEQRIKELNQTLVKVDFRSGRYLQLQPQRIKHERLRALEAAMRKVRGAALKDDEGESHYKALRELVEILREASDNRRLLGSRALLDPRYRLQFFVVEVDRQTGGQSPPRTGSQSGSGGEKELMASHILTASLSYALCPSGASRPLYATVVLDEAFSKSSPSAAGRIIEALRIFCLHPIFVTPNKEIGLLKRHTRKVICVQRPAKDASIASISWERLEEFVRPQ